MDRRNPVPTEQHQHALREFAFGEPARGRDKPPHETGQDKPTPARAGARSLEQLRQRCRIDDETGCWIWAAAMSRSKVRDVEPVPKVWLPDASKPGAGQLMGAARAAWILAGKPLVAGQVVWRHVCNRADCINPAHGKAGTRVEMGASIAAAGVNRGDPERAAVNLRNAKRMATPLDRVEVIERLLDENVSCAAIARAFRMTDDTVRRIRDGRHVHSTRQRRGVRAASVFNLGIRA